MKEGLSRNQKVLKRLFDLFFAFIGLVLLIIPLLILIAMATISTGKFGLYSQNRIGLHGESFVMYKIRSMSKGDDASGITLKSDPRITTFGRFIRDFKLDELPQLWNVLIGDMSFVGPRPDIPGYADRLSGKDRIILSVRPGITGPATIKFKDEETLLAEQIDPITYNDEVLWKEKIEINKTYIKNWSLKSDINYILRTLFH
ncbi:sugar transferase [Lutimonas vermicola]|uniref:Sugar transferase n=1 Tax=Lutimonas vermicola TaxID=414288 RepID=A0ABU9KZB0_9FLAO